MTVRNYKSDELKERVDVKESMTFREGYENLYIDHINYFTNGAVVAYGDEDEKAFVYVMEASE